MDAVRNFKVLDKMPILFPDEFDSDPSKYALLLPLLWDGEVHVGHRDLKTGMGMRLVVYYRSSYPPCPIFRCAYGGVVLSRRSSTGLPMVK